MPKVSLITPTNDPRYLDELASSIGAQTFKDFEWVICPNNGAGVQSRWDFARVCPVPFTSASIGALKQWAFAQAAGEILVEVDHDDVLSPDCLQEIVREFDLNPRAGFVYSNAVRFPRQRPYDAACGWEHRTIEWRGESYPEPISFPCDPRSLSRIWYCPDHVRCWRRSVYQATGGHKPDLAVLDDQDLMIRTYLHTEMRHVNLPLYFSRVRSDRQNAQIVRNAEIQKGTEKLFHTYAYLLAERWADLHGLAKIDLGGGSNCPAGYVGVDLLAGGVSGAGREIIPMDDGAVGVIRAHDVLEHLPDKQKIMRECWRVLADGGWLMAEVPSTDGRGAFQDPTHVSFWNENAFWYWTRRQQARSIRNDQIGFQEFRLETRFPSEWHRKHNIPYTVAYLAAIKSTARRPHYNWFTKEVSTCQ